MPEFQTKYLTHKLNILFQAKCLNLSTVSSFQAKYFICKLNI